MTASVRFDVASGFTSRYHAWKVQLSPAITATRPVGTETMGRAGRTTTIRYPSRTMSTNESPGIGALGMFLAILVIVCCALGGPLAGLSEPRGVGTATRALLSAVGMAGGILLILRKPIWFPLLVIWAVLQIPVVIVDPSGPLTNQAFHLGVIQSRSSSVNGTVVEASGFGFNLAGLIFLIWAVVVNRRWRARFSRD